MLKSILRNSSRLCEFTSSWRRENAQNGVVRRTRTVVRLLLGLKIIYSLCFVLFEELFCLSDAVVEVCRYRYIHNFTVSLYAHLCRRSYFEVFWYTHHLFVVFFVGLIVHGMQWVYTFLSRARFCITRPGKQRALVYEYHYGYNWLSRARRLTTRFCR